jgi:creatinine amidohydrolase/Fe(II)-dependent formamide hydrolase-like protein
LLTNKGFREEEVGTHAGLADTSLTLAVDPRLVRTDRLQPGDGANGDPRRSSAELGQLGVDLIVTRTVDAIRKAANHR